MITVTEAATLKHGDVLEHVRLKDSRKAPMRIRVNGRVKFWKTRPAEFQIPVKHGLKACFYITISNAADWQKAGV